MIIHNLSSIGANNMYTVEEAFERLKQYGITENIEVVRRWLRQGKLRGIKPEKRRDGWRIPKENLDAFILERVPGLNQVINATKIVKEQPDIINTTNVVNEEIERLQEEINQLHEKNQQQVQKIALLAAQKVDLENEVKSLKSPKGGWKKRALLLESIILERYDILSRVIKTYSEQEESDYLEGIKKQEQRELAFLESVIRTLQIPKGQYEYIDGFNLEKQGINLWGDWETDGNTT
jgi:FtsZ-binding cell division protein ZapB